MEIFKTIQGYDDIYKISNYGNVTSKNKLLKQEVIKRNHTNYRRVSLSKNGKVKRYQVHRLVAEYFVNNENNDPIVNHLDNNGENNHYKNLEWTTHIGNMEHSRKQGRQNIVQQKGGFASGKIAKNKQIKRIENLIGKTFGEITVLKEISFGAHPRILVRCNSCNSEYETHTGKVYKNEETSCRQCGLIKNAKKMVEKTIDSLENSVINNRKIENVIFEKNKYKGIVTCLDCNKSKFMYLHPMLRKENPTLCSCRQIRKT